MRLEPVERTPQHEIQRHAAEADSQGYQHDDFCIAHCQLPLGDTGRPGASYAQPPLPAFTGLLVFAFWVALDRTSTEGFLDAMV